MALVLRWKRCSDGLMFIYETRRYLHLRYESHIFVIKYFDEHLKEIVHLMVVFLVQEKV